MSSGFSLLRGGVGALGWIAMVWLGIGAKVGAAEPFSGRPNVVIILSDDQGWRDYGFMGHEHISTPRLDRLAAESITFRRGYSPVPLCCPALASITTGRYPHENGITGNDPAGYDRGMTPARARFSPRDAPLFRAFDQVYARNPNLVRTLSEAGYSTLQTGKWWHGDPMETGGFTHAMTRGNIGGESRHGDMGLGIGREGLGAIRYFIEQEVKRRPFFLWYAPMLPHEPHTPPAELLEKYRRVAPTEAIARYWGNVEWFDRTCGELIDFLEAKGLRENTIIIYTCDNGWEQDPERIDRFTARSKRSPYELGVRTPIMISWPAHLQPRMDDEHLATNLDIWPTLAALLQVPAPDGLPGIDLTNTNKVAGRTSIYGENHAHDIPALGQPERGLLQRWMIEGHWKLVVPADAAGELDPVELYDLSQDPFERTDLSREFPQKTAKLRSALDAWWNPTHEPSVTP